MDTAVIPAMAGAELQPAAALLSDSHLVFYPLSVIEQDGELVVGDSERGIFLVLPEVGVIALQELQAGATIAQAAVVASRHAGQDIDVLDFAMVLIEAGLVIAVDGRPLAAAARPAQTWLAGVRPELVRPLFSPLAWTIYGALFVSCLAIFVAQPQLWPAFEDFFFYPDPAVCIVVMTVINLVLMAGHEIYHWLAGRAAGVAAQFSISRRMFFIVFETDLSQLWSVPRRQRYSPFLAGMAFDTLVLTICLGLRLLWGVGALDLPPLLHRFLGALALVQVFGLGWQALVFLRTDLYAVLITALGCFNLYRVTFLALKVRLWRLSPAETAELAEAHPRDVQVARWFGWLCLVGLVWIGYMFINFFIPSTIIFAGWIFGSLWGAPLGSGAFWEALAIGSLAALQGLLPLLILTWQRIQQRKGVAL